MQDNPVIAKLGRRLRLGVIGGGSGSFIGEVHRRAARFDDRYEVVASVLSSNPDRSRAQGSAIGISRDRAYGTAEEFFSAEAARADGIDVVAIMTPNDSHYRLSCVALAHGLDIICDKPLTTTLDDAVDLVRRVDKAGLVFCLTYNYTGYPMVRQAQAMVAAGELGDIRLVQVNYVQGHNAAVRERDDPGAIGWRSDAAKAGPSLVLGDIGTHAHHLSTFITMEQVAEVCADVAATVPGRNFDDHAGALLRFANGARGLMWVAHAAAGAEHGLHIRVFGAKGGLEWDQEEPNHLRFSPLGRPVQLLARSGPGTGTAAASATRVAIGHPEGYQEAFANLYSAAAEAIVARRTGQAPHSADVSFPSAADGARGIKFIEAALASSRAGGTWADCRL